MKKTFKKIIAYVVTVAILTVSVAGTTVSAATSFAFNFGISDSYNCIILNKYNNVNYATVNITSVNLSNTSAVIWIADYSGRKITPTKAVTGTGIYTLNYSTPVTPGSSVKFCASGGYYGVQISGTIEV